MIKNTIAIVSIFILLLSCSKINQPADPVPQHESFTIKSKILNEDRIINVWLPQDYNSNAQPLQVVYMPDGGINEDFPHVANTLQELLAQNKISPLILVGIQNTQRRRDLTGITQVESDKKIAPQVGGANNFRDFISQELFPEINNRYNTNTTKTILGESAAGLFVIETFLLQPQMFDNYIAFDPSLWWNNNELVNNAKQYLNKHPNNPKKLWFTASNTPDITPHANNLAKALQEHKYTNLNFKFTNQPNQKHNTIFRATKEMAFLYTLNNK